MRAFDGASEFVARAHGAGSKIVLASSAEADELQHYVALLGIDKYLTATTSIDDVETSKTERSAKFTTLDRSMALDGVFAPQFSQTDTGS